jgi:hypothetical protein
MNGPGLFVVHGWSRDTSLPRVRQVGDHYEFSDELMFTHNFKSWVEALEFMMGFTTI